MSFDWLGYLTLADYMNDNADKFPDQEACYRSVVSRAYYSVYCLIRNYVRDIDDVAFHSDDHHKLQEHLRNHPHRPRQRLGNQIRELHQHRKKADYDDNLDELPVNKAKRALAQARRIERSVAQLSKT